MQKRVTEDPGNAEILGMKAPSHASLGVVGQMLRIMAPPGAVVVPEMVIRVGGDESDCKYGFGAHGGDVLDTRNPGNKKAPVDRMIRKGALDKPGEIFVQRISPAAHRRAFAFQPPWDFSVPGWQPLVSPKGIPDASTFIAEAGGGCKPTKTLPCVINFPRERFS